MIKDNIGFTIEGLREVERALKELGPKLSNQLFKSYNRKAGTMFVVKNLRSGLPYSMETRKGIKVVTSKSDNNPNAIYAGPTSDVFWLRFADKGTEQRYTEKGAYRGQIVGKNQIEGIIDAQVDPILNYATKEFGKEINKFLEKRLKKLKK